MLIHKGLRANGEKDRATNGKIVYHTGGKRLTCSEPQPDPAVATAPDFQGAATARSCHYARHSTCAAIKRRARGGIFRTRTPCAHVNMRTPFGIRLRVLIA